MKILAGAPERVARALLDGGPATVSSLAARLGLSAAVVRRHLDGLEADGVVEAGERAPYGPAPVRGRGRPAKVYALTQAGRDAFDQAYDDLAVGALRYLAETVGEEAVADFARRRAEELERRYAARVSGTPDPAEAAATLAEALSEDGFAATAVPVTGGEQVCQHHCPVAHVATEFPQLCEAETEAFSRLLGTHVLRLATLAHGDGVCTTHVPLTATGRTAS